MTNTFTLNSVERAVSPRTVWRKACVSLDILQKCMHFTGYSTERCVSLWTFYRKACISLDILEKGMYHILQKGMCL